MQCSYCICFLSESHKCGPGEFTCARGVCIRDAWRCDGDNDCRDWSDETNCTGERKQTNLEEICSEIHHIYILNVSLFLVLSHKVGHHTCESSSFQCHTGHCIPQRWVCDGDDDCQDGSDEDPTQCGQSQALPYSPSCHCKPLDFLFFC